MTWTVEQITARGGSRFYRATNTETGEMKDLWSVTTVTKVMPAPALERWKFGQIAAGIATNDDLRLLAISGDDEAKEAAYQALERQRSAANRGTAIHKVSETVTCAADAFNVAAELRPVMERYGRMLDEHGIVIRQTEIVLLNFTHGYAGTADRLCVHPTLGRVVGDLKSGKVGFFEQAMQLAALANADHAYVNGELIPVPADINRDTGLIFHVPEDGETADVWAMPLPSAWEAFTHCAALKHLLAAEDNKGQVGEKLEPVRRFADNYVDWIRSRLAEHAAEHPGIVSQFNAWRLMAFGDRSVDSYTTDELEACLTALCDLEAREQLPFPSVEYPHPHGPRLTTNRIAELEQRIADLPAWCLAAVADHMAKLPSLDQWRIVDAEQFEAVLTEAESQRDSLQTSIRELAGGLPLDGWDQLVAHLELGPVASWSWTDFDIAARVVDALTEGWLTVTGDGIEILPTIVDRLVDKHGSKADATKAIRARVAELGLDLPVPRSLGDCCTDPVLVALAA